MKKFIIFFLVLLCHSASADVTLDGAGGDKLGDTTYGLFTNYHASIWVNTTSSRSQIIDVDSGPRFQIVATWAPELLVSHSTTDMKRTCDDNSITSGQWHHLAVEAPKSSTASDVHIYVDGVECSYKNTIDGVGIVASPLAPYNINIGVSLNATITEFAIWSGTNFAAGEVVALANKVKYLPLQIGTTPSRYHPLDDCAQGDTGCNTWKEMFNSGRNLSASGDAVGAGENILSYP